MKNKSNKYSQNLWSDTDTNYYKMKLTVNPSREPEFILGFKRDSCCSMFGFSVQCFVEHCFIKFL